MARATLSCIRARLARQDGFGIIEVLVSALVVALAAVGTFAALDSATATSGLNKARGVAASLAQADQERLRSMTPSSLATLPPTTQKTVDRKVFTIASTAEWVADRTGTPSCSSSDGKTDYLRITSSVTWPSMGAISPVRSESLRAVPKGAFRPNEGSIAVKVIDRNGLGLANIAVTIAGPTSYPATNTNAAGCVIIDRVPIGTYTVSVNQAGYVGEALPTAPPVPNQLLTEQTVVVKEQTSSTTFTYDRAGTVTALFRTTSAVVTTPEPNATVTTAGERFTVGHTGLGFPNYRAFSRATASNSVLSSGPPHTLFPFTTPYKIWAGSCPEADPQLYGAPEQTALVPPGGTIASVQVREPRLSVTVKRYTTAAQTAAASANVASGRVVIKPVVAGCALPFAANTPSGTGSNGTVVTAVPYGDYSICAQVGTGTGTTTAQRTTVIRRNIVSGGTNYNVAYNASVTPPANAAVMLPFATVSGSCPG